MDTPNSFKELIYLFLDLIDVVLPVVASLALLAFLWGLAKFIFRVGGDEKAVTDGKNLMIWGVIALFILVSFMGIVTFLQNDLGFDRTGVLPLLPENSPEN